MPRLVPRVLCWFLLLLVGGIFVLSQQPQPDCSQAESCDLCGDPMLNLTGCVWRFCANDSGTGACVIDDSDSADSSLNCSWTREAELCIVVEVVAVDETEGDSGGDKFSQAKFDMSSFIGGIILVLLLQASGVIVMRFLKSKEQSNYDPIEQP